MKLLLVDECLENRATYRRYLLGDKQHSYKILEAATGEQALLLCCEQLPDAIVLDYLLPDMDGQEFLKELKTQFGQITIPVIILTDWGNEEIAVQVMKSGAADYLVKKNITPESLYLAVRNVLEKTRWTEQPQEMRGHFQTTLNRVAQTAWQQKNELLETLIESAPVMLMLFDPNGQLIWANREWEKVFGWRVADIQRRDLWAEWYPDLEYHQYIRDLSVAVKARTRDGKVLDTAWTNIRLSDGSNIGIGQDISDSKQFEQKLIVSEEQYRLLFENNPNPMWIFDPESLAFLGVNQAAIAHYGYSKSEFLAMTLVDIRPPEDIPAFGKAIEQSRSHNCAFIYRGEWRHRKRDGSIIDVEITGRPITWEGKPADFVMVNDISDRKQAEKKIREQAALLDIATDAIFVRDLAYRILYWNSGAERLYGWQVAEILGKDCRKFLYKKISPQVENAFKTVIEQGEWHGELNKIAKSGQEIIVQSRWNLVRDETGQAKSILCVDSNITEKKQLEQQFYQLQRLESLGTLASGIAHDLNNILTPILAVAKLLPLKLPNMSNQNRELLKILEENSQRGTELVKQILSFAGRGEGKRIPLQPRHLLKEIERVVKITFPKSIEICIHLPTSDLWIVSADPTQIHQVLMNLCVNARDAMPHGGTLNISAVNFCVDANHARMNPEAKVGKYVAITVLDTGCGMSKDLLERIFEPFFTTKESGKGTGLGLSTVVGIIKNHDGFFTVDSEVGKGSQFKVYLPAINQSAAP